MLILLGVVLNPVNTHTHTLYVHRPWSCWMSHHRCCRRPSGTARCRRCRAARRSPAGRPGNGRCCWAGWDVRTLGTWSARWTELDPGPRLSAWDDREMCVRRVCVIFMITITREVTASVCSPSDPRRRLWAAGSWWGLSWRWAVCRSSSALWAFCGLPWWEGSSTNMSPTNQSQPKLTMRRKTSNLSSVWSESEPVGCCYQKLMHTTKIY